jgi:hypothetical protein
VKSVADKVKGIQYMKRLGMLAGCVVVMLIFFGCERQSQKITNPAQVKNEAQKYKFPPSMVGVWQENEYNWAFKFEPDGSISKLVHMWGMRMVVEDGGFYEEGVGGRNAVYVLGPCETTYNPDTKQLSVVITLDYFRMEIPPEALEGKIKDYFDGPVSKDGKEWRVNWRSYGWIEGALPPDANVIEANPEKLVFTKLDIK